ncbi:MAG: 2-phosphosulfolactate phosphatase [Bacteroidales bacterium]
MPGPLLEVCFSPALLEPFRERKAGNVVVVDILRATTAMCIAFGYGVASVTPVGSEPEALRMKQQGWLVAGEKDGVKLPYADYGNSPQEFRNNDITGKHIAYSTTNGTRAIHSASGMGQALIASFVNLEAVCNWLGNDRKDLLILCAGWKDEFSLEDALFAGAMVDLLTHHHDFIAVNDAAIASAGLWNHSAKRLMKVMSQTSHYLRLLAIEGRKGLKYCFFPEKFMTVPILKEGKLVDINAVNKTVQ